MKTERQLEIEKHLGWSENQIHDAMDILHDSTFAETKQDSELISITFDSSIQKLCFDYLEEYDKIKN
jgi:hypothetical protein